jgi:hypothetical protein
MADQNSAARQGVRITPDIVGMDALLAQIPDHARRHQAAIAILNAISTKAREEITRRIPRRTASTQRSIGQRVFQEGEGYAIIGDFLGSGKRVALWLEKGTGLFGPRRARIYPRHAKALRWNQGTTGPGGNLRLTGSFRRQAGLHSVIGGPNSDAGPVAGYSFARSIAGMKPQPSFKPGWESTVPFVPVVLAEVGRRALSREGFIGPKLGGI